MPLRFWLGPFCSIGDCSAKAGERLAIAAAREERCALADEIRNETREETRARRTRIQQERDARKAAKEQACQEQERAELLYELSLYRDRAGIYASHPKTKERYTWREYLADRWSSDPDTSRMPIPFWSSRGYLSCNSMTARFSVTGLTNRTVNFPPLASW